MNSILLNVFDQAIGVRLTQALVHFLADGLIIVICGLAMIVPANAGEASVAVQLPDKFHVVVRDFKNVKVRFEGDVKLADRRQTLPAPDSFKLSFAKVITVQLRKDSTGARLDVLFDFLGEARDERRILVDLKGLDADGKTVHHTWRMGSDVRTYKGPANVGRMRLSFDPYSSVWLELPTHLLPKLHTLEFVLREMSPDDLQHFPDKPSKTDMMITRPDNEGRFTISFDNPIDEIKPGRWLLSPEKNQVIFQVIIKNAEGKLQEKIFKQLAADPTGGYRVDATVKPEWFKYSSVSVSFVTIQPDHDKWVNAFFHKGEGTTYRGLWSGDGGSLTKIKLNGEHVGWLEMADGKANPAKAP